MFFRIQLLALNIGSTVLLIFFLCLGSQNLAKKYSIDFIINKTVLFPIGFLVGTSFSFGVLSGGLTSVLMASNKNNDED